MKRCRRLILCLVLSVCITRLLGQDLSQDTASITISSSLSSGIDDKISAIDNRLTKQSDKYLKNLSKQEEKIFKKLAKLDSSAAANALGDAKEKYNQLSQKLNNASGRMDKLLSGKYLPVVDSLATSLGFLKDADNIVSKTKDIQQKLGSSLKNLQQLQSKLNEAGNIQQYVQQCQQQLKELLSNYADLPKDISKYFGKYQQQAFYYGQQLNELKESLNQPDKLIAKTLTVLQKIPAFQKFWSKNSMLAAMFPTPDNYGTPQALAGLQTRANVQQVLQQQIGLPATSGSNANPAQYLQQQMQQAQEQLSQLKDKLNQLGINNGGSSDMVIPDKKINPEKTKSFLKRIQLGSSFQSQRATNYFPTTTDIALTAGYKLNDKSIIGIGLSGKMGWGQGWKHIKITGQGVGTRAFAEWKSPDLFKTKGKFMASLWFYAGAELNYNRTIESLAVFKNYSNWSKSALAGLSKKYSMRSPLKKGKQVQGSMQFYTILCIAKTYPIHRHWCGGWDIIFSLDYRKTDTTEKTGKRNGHQSAI